MEEFINAGALPRSLLEAIVKDLAPYSVAFLRLRDSSHGQEAELLGSGTLVTVGQTHAILTAHHVVRVLPRSGRLAILLEKTREPHTIDAAGLVFLEIARGAQDSHGPDLGAVILSPPIANTIAAKKSFFNLDYHKEIAIHNPPDVADGVWLVQGFLDEGTVVTLDPDGLGRTTRFYNYSGFCRPKFVTPPGDYDYIEFSVEKEKMSLAPHSWGGMSGGGVWQVSLTRDGDNLLHKAPLLSGIAFYQQPTTETSCGVKCHGIRSVYLAATDAIRNRES